MKAYSPDWSVVSVRGTDAVAFIQNLCTNDVKRLADGEACEAFFTDVKGRILAHAIVCRPADGCQVVVTSPNADKLAQHLDRYHIREDLELSVDHEANPILRLGESTGGYEVAGLGAKLSVESSDASNAARMSDAEFHTHRLEHAFPLDQVDVDDRRLPQEVNRDSLAISFTKGCYLGQETVARIDALGHVNWLLVKLRLEGENKPSPGDAIWVDEKPVGEITSAAWSPREGATLLLGYARREHAAEGTRVETSAGPATVL